MRLKRDSLGTPIPNFNSDAFDRARVSSPVTIFDDKHLYGKNTIGKTGLFNWIYIESGGLATYNGSDSAIDLATDLTSGSSVIKQTRRYLQYEPGKSQLYQFTGVFGDTTEAVEQKVGPFENNNGLYFGVFSGGQYGVGVRNDATGTVVNSIVYQTEWNNDVMDGSGKKNNPSRLNLDRTKGAVWVIDHQWLSMGSVRFGMQIGSDLHIVHESHHANLSALPYTRTPTLPIRYEIKNLDTLTTSVNLKSICAVAISEGAESIESPTFHVTHASSLRTVGVKEPVMAVRLLNSYLGRDTRIKAKFRTSDFYAAANDSLFTVEHVTAPNSIEANWLQVDSGVSAMEYTLDITSIDGGTVFNVFNTYVGGGSGKKGGSEGNISGSARDPHEFIVQNFDSTESEVFVIYAQSVPGANANVGVVFAWEEVQ